MTAKGNTKNQIIILILLEWTLKGVFGTPQPLTANKIPGNNVNGMYTVDGSTAQYQTAGDVGGSGTDYTVCLLSNNKNGESSELDTEQELLPPTTTSKPFHILRTTH